MENQSAQCETRHVQKNLAFRLGAEMQVWTMWAEGDQGQGHCAHLTLHRPLTCSALLPVQWRFLHSVPQDGGGGGQGACIEFTMIFSPEFHTENFHSRQPVTLPPPTIGAHHPQALSSSLHSQHTSWIPVPRTEPAT